MCSVGMIQCDLKNKFRIDNTIKLTGQQKKRIINA